MTDLPETQGPRAVVASELDEARAEITKLEKTRSAMRTNAWVMGGSVLLALLDLLFGDSVNWNFVVFASVVALYSAVVVLRSRRSIIQLESVLEERSEALTELSEA